jgi:hypothetical protein
VGQYLVDGHNRYGICQKHGLPFKTVQNERFQNMEDVHLWMIDQHLGRRSVSDFQRGVLALRKREIIAERRARRRCRERRQAEAAQPPRSALGRRHRPRGGPGPGQRAKVPDQALDTREALARAARLSAGQVKMIETIQEKAAPEVVAAVKAGELSPTPPPWSPPAEEEQQAVAAEGADDLKQAAKRVRDAKKSPRPPSPKPPIGEAAAPPAPKSCRPA